MNSPWLTILTATPFAGGLALLALRSEQRALARTVALIASLASLALVVALWVQFDFASGALQFEARHAWIPSLAVDYRLGIDGLGLMLLSLTALVVPMSILASWRLRDRAHLYFGLVLLLQAGLFGTFTALNFFHWFLFWELSLIPAFFLVRFWGGPLRASAATQFFVYTMAGSVALLLAFLAIFLATGTFDFIELAQLGGEGQLAKALAAKLNWAGGSPDTAVLLVFTGVFLGFAVKVPVVPFHSWLPPAYTEASPGTTMLLTGLMSKMGIYGFMRILLPIFPDQIRALLPMLLWLTIITIVFSAAVALAQRDLRSLLAYSSINHLGYCVLGILAVTAGASTAFPQQERTAALSGAMLQVFNHGLTAATLFWMTGMLEQRSAGLRGLDEFGGLRKVAPVFCGLMGIAFFSSLGLPGLNGFIGEFLIFKGAFPLVTWAASLSVLGLLLTAVFLLTAMQRLFHGPLNERWANWPDLEPQERAWLALPVALMFLLGVYPQWLLAPINAAALNLVRQLGG